MAVVVGVSQKQKRRHHVVVGGDGDHQVALNIQCIDTFRQIKTVDGTAASLIPEL